jgi:hypothetical protein
MLIVFMLSVATLIVAAPSLPLKKPFSLKSEESKIISSNKIWLLSLDGKRNLKKKCLSY